jgi:anaerobic dimethyl sulfoxide reductase subunit C (anchor subunit)
MAVGVFFVAETLSLSFFRKFGFEKGRSCRLFLRALSLIPSILAVAVSFFHLGSPSRALHILNNLKSSWLSREILFLAIFVTLMALLAALEWWRIRMQSIQCFLVFVGGLSGVGLIFSMSRLYMLPTVPVWNSFFTPASFFAVSFLLGNQLAAAGCTAFLTRTRNQTVQEIQTHWNQNTIRQIEILSLFLIGAVFSLTVFFFLHFGYSEKGSDAALSLIVRNKSAFFAVRLLLTLIGAFLLGVSLALLKKNNFEKKKSRLFIYSGFLVLLLAEILGRYLFYEVYVRLGL